MQIRPASAHEVMDLRHAVLRHGLPRQTAMFPGDDAPTAKHFIAEQDGKVIGCATLHLNEWNQTPAWQLRGMAVDPAHQGQGVGSALLNAIGNAVAASQTNQLWCNARIHAAEFYRKHGWQTASEVLEIPHAGPHVKMIKSAEPARVTTSPPS